MKPVSATQLREKSSSDLRALLTEREKELFQLRMQHFTGQLEKSSRLGTTRREIARIMTVLRERQEAAR